MLIYTIKILPAIVDLVTMFSKLIISSLPTSCDMELDCGGIKGNWIRIVRNDTRRGNTCPSGWNSHKLCCTGSSAADCYSAHFSLNSRSYSKVCGRYYETRKEVWMVYFQLHMHMEKLEVTNQKIITMITKWRIC